MEINKVPMVFEVCKTMIGTLVFADEDDIRYDIKYKDKTLGLVPSKYTSGMEVVMEIELDVRRTKFGYYILSPERLVEYNIIMVYDDDLLLPVSVTDSIAEKRTFEVLGYSKAKLFSGDNVSELEVYLKDKSGLYSLIFWRIPFTGGHSIMPSLSKITHKEDLRIEYKPKKKFGINIGMYEELIMYIGTYRGDYWECSNTFVYSRMGNTSKGKSEGFIGINSSLFELI